jgi:hypothetical protein
MSATLPIVRATVYTDGFVTADNSMLPRSVARAWWGAEVRDALATWAPEREGALVLDRDRLADLLAEKEAALDAARDLTERVHQGEIGLDPALHAAVQAAFAHFETWVEGHCLAARVCLLARFVKTQGAHSLTADREALQAAANQLEAFADRIAPLVQDAGIPHHVVMLLDHRRARDTAREGHALAAAATPS